MFTLNNKVPPPVVALICGGIAWLLAAGAPSLSYQVSYRVPIAIGFVLIGLALDISRLLAFRAVKTTVNPLAPDRTTAMVQSGPYQFTRNPMYLGMASMLMGYCAYLSNPVSLAGVIIFVAYITRFQIIPEERVLAVKFGEPFMQYSRSVRRWL